MLYLDYSRPAGGWIPNQHGGRENLEAIAFLRRFNTELFARFPQATTAAEESTAWPQVSSRRHPVRPALRILREFHPAAVPRRGRARQALDPRENARRRMAALRQPPGLLQLHVRPSRQEAVVHGMRV